MNYSLIIFLSCFLADICSSPHYRYLNIACAIMSLVRTLSSSRLTVYEIEFVVAVYCCLVYQLLFFLFFSFEYLIINYSFIRKVI